MLSDLINFGVIMSDSKRKTEKTIKVENDKKELIEDELDQNHVDQVDDVENDLSLLSREELEEKYLSVLQDKQQIEKEKQEFYNKFLLSVANQDNLKKRYEKEIADLKKYFVADIAKEIINVMDNISFACDDKYDGENSFNRVVEVAKLTRKTINDLFDKFHIQSVKTNIGDDFNYDIHNAISYLESDDYSEGKIVKVMQQGYKLHDRLLRPSLVALAKKK